MRPVAPEVAALAAQMFQRKLRTGAVMREANVNPSTWSRWAAGADPKASSLAAVRAAIEKLSGEI